MRTVAYWLSLLLIFTIPWENLVNLPGFGTVSTFIGLLLAAVWVAAVIFTGKIRKPRPFHLIFFLFVFWNIVSVLWSIDTNETSARLRTYALLIGFVYIIWDLFTTPQALEAGLQAYVLGAWVSIASLVFNYVTGIRASYTRFSAAGFDPNNIGIILALGIPIAWHLATSENRYKAVRWLSIVNFLYVPAALFAIILTGSRGALLATLPAFLFILASFQRLRLSLRILIFIGLATCLYVLQPLVPVESFARLATTADSISQRDMNGRVAIWEAGLDVFSEYPLLGVGSNAFRNTTDIAKLAHNSYLSVLVETGILGFILFAVIWVLAFNFALRHPKRTRRFWLSVLIVLAVGIFSLNWAHRKQTWLFPGLVVVSAALVSHQMKPESSRIPLAPPLNKGIATPSPD